MFATSTNWQLVETSSSHLLLVENTVWRTLAYTLHNECYVVHKLYAVTYIKLLNKLNPLRLYTRALPNIPEAKTDEIKLANRTIRRINRSINETCPRFVSTLRKLQRWMREKKKKRKKKKKKENIGRNVINANEGEPTPPPPSPPCGVTPGFKFNPSCWRNYNASKRFLHRMDRRQLTIRRCAIKGGGGGLAASVGCWPPLSGGIGLKRA